MTLAAPLWLLAIPAALGAAVAITRATARRRAALPGEFGGLSDRDARPFRLGAEWLGGLLLVAGLALPRVDRVEGAPPRPAICVVDVSRSMLAEDEAEGTQPARNETRFARAATRYARALEIFRRALVPMEGRRVGLITFAGAADEIAPPTTDLAALRALLDEVDPRRVLDPGSAANLGLEKALARLKATGGDLFLFSDGEWEAEGEGDLAIAAAATAAHVAIHVVPLGGAAPIALVHHDADGVTTPMVDHEGKAAVSRADRPRMVALAHATHGRVLEGDLCDASFAFAAPAENVGSGAKSGLALWTALLAGALFFLALAHGLRERIA